MSHPHPVLYSLSYIYEYRVLIDFILMVSTTHKLGNRRTRQPIIPPPPFVFLIRLTFSSLLLLLHLEIVLRFYLYSAGLRILRLLILCLLLKLQRKQCRKESHTCIKRGHHHYLWKKIPKKSVNAKCACFINIIVDLLLICIKIRVSLHSDQCSWLMRKNKTLYRIIQ